MSEVIGVFIVFVLFPGIILGFILASRYLKYRETLTMIEHGITPPSPPPPAPAVITPPMPQYPVMPPMQPMPPRPVAAQQAGPGRGTLIWGLVLSGVGLALTLALWPIGFIANSASGNTVTFPLGLGPWMLAGFVPLFVGLALILGFVIMRPERGALPNPPPTHTAQWASAPSVPTGGGAVGAVREPPSPEQALTAPTEAAATHDAPGAVPPGAPSA